MVREHILRREVHAEDDSWQFQVDKNFIKLHPNVIDETGEKIWIKSVKFTHKSIVFSNEKQPTNRILCEDSNNKFLLVSFASFRLPELPPKATADYIGRVLAAGIVLNNEKYMFYGHSNSQLKSRSCYLYNFGAALKAAVLDTLGREVFRKLNSFGDFSNFNSVAKRAKRIGLLFSAAESSLKLEPENTMDIDDIEDAEGHIFTDGCGLLSLRLAQVLAKRRKIIFHQQRYVPAAFQIRYKGYKGMLMVKKDLEPNILVQFRSSMQKFKNCPNNTFSVLDYSKPFTYAYLNGELVTLLSALGIQDAVFLQKQQTYFEFLKLAPVLPQLAFQYFCYKGLPEFAERVLLDGLDRRAGRDELQKKLQKLTKEEFKLSFKQRRNNDPNEEDDAKVRILILDSRILFGVCDYTGVALKEGECQVRIMTETGEYRTLDGAEVIVSRNPCLHPGDIRKFRAVRPPPGLLDHLVDCIVFPTVGARDPASLMSGGDLDGDKFFVSWDQDLIPSTLHQPYGYPPAKETTRRQIKYEDMIKYFSGYNNASLGRVKNLYLDWARISKKGAASDECQELNRLFSGCVDGEQIRIPDRLQNPPPRTETTKPFILDLLIEEVKKNAAKDFEQDLESYYESGSREVVEDILSISDRLSLIDEYELFSFVFKWVKQHSTGASRESDLESLLPHFDFGSFTTPQKAHVLECLHSVSHSLRDRYVASVWNGLNSSYLLGRNELEKTQLTLAHLRWQLLYSTDMDNGTRLHTSLERALESFDKKLLIFKVDIALTVAMYIPMKIENGKIVDVGQGQRLKLFAFDPKSGYSIERLTLHGDRIAYDGEIIQLFNKNRTDSFIWFALNQNWMKRNGITPQEEDGNFKVSIALQKFDPMLRRVHQPVRKQPSSGLEIYVISNRDRVGHQILDIQARQVDTTEIMSNLENTPRDYTLGQTGFDESTIPAWMKPIFLEETAEMDHLNQPQLVELVDVCIYMKSVHKLFRVLNHPVIPVLGFNTILDAVRAFPEVSVLILPFFEAGKIQLPEPREDAALHFLKYLIISCNESKESALELTRRFLKWMAIGNIQIALPNLIDLIKRILFTVRHPKIAQELINETISYEGLLVGEAQEIRTYVRKFLLGISMNYLGEVMEKCPCDHRGIPIGAEEAVARMAMLPQADTPANVRRNAAICKNYTLSDFIERAKIFSQLNQDQEETDFSNVKPPEPAQICLDLKPSSNNNGLYETMLRNDLGQSSLRNEDHIRFTASKRAVDSPCRKITTFDAVVQSIQQGKVEFYILQAEPVEILTANWNLYICASTTNMSTEFSALKKLIRKKEVATSGFHDIVELDRRQESPATMVDEELDFPGASTRRKIRGDLNESQAEAVRCALSNPMSLIHGPPGTGKTTVVVEIIRQYEAEHPGMRMLVTASSHNAVDNVMGKFLKAREKSGDKKCEDVVRLASDTGKISGALKKWTLEAFLGTNLHLNDKAKSAAQKKLKEARIIFSTCSGAGVGFLRESDAGNGPLHIGPQTVEDKKKKKPSSEKFDVVIVDEASQITEPTAIVPLVKNSKRVILVGDHVQLCPTVTEIGKEFNLHISLFEKLHDSKTTQAKKVMLNVQYRMHPDLARFPSARFYDGKLGNGVSPEQRQIRPSGFPWPRRATDTSEESQFPVVFINCDSLEDRSYASSKSNEGQVKLVAHIVKLLQTVPKSTEQNGTVVPPMEISILTPYTKQKVAISKQLHAVKGVEVNTIDGFQGREAEVIIFSTVRANRHQALGFFEDAQRINVALTRASHGLIVIGHEETLAGGGDISKAMVAACEKISLK